MASEQMVRQGNELNNEAECRNERKPNLSLQDETRKSK